MSKFLKTVGVLLSLWVLFLGVYNVVAHKGGSTAELQQAQLWMGIITLSVGVGLLLNALQLTRK